MDKIVQCSAEEQESTVQCRAVQYSAMNKIVQCRAEQYSAMNKIVQCRAEQYSTVP
jgi:hypothetical protein